MRFRTYWVNQVRAGARAAVMVGLGAFVLNCGRNAPSESSRLGSVSSALTAADCPAGYNVIQGTAGPNTLTGTARNDCILGLGGNDVIDGFAGQDVLIGGDGNDTLRGGLGNDTLHGEAGNDTLVGGIGDDVLRGGAGNDDLDGGEGRDELGGDDGNDILAGGLGADLLNGGLGDDQLSSGLGGDTLNGDAGNDILTGGVGSDTLNGGDGDDRIAGSLGNDNISGGDGNDVIDPGLGTDTVQAGDGHDAVESSGNDSINGGPGTDACLGIECELGSPIDCISDVQCGPDKRCLAATGTCLGCFDDRDCTSANRCQQNAVCQAGTCAGGQTVACVALDQCHEVGVCDPHTGHCSNPSKSEGSSCEDGNSCTQVDRCSGGACVGTDSVACVAISQCHVPGVCDPATGVCSTPLKPGLTECSGELSLKIMGPNIGLSPFDVRLKAYPVLPTAIERVVWDFDHDGMADISNSNLYVEHTFDQVGQYRPVVTVTDVDGAEWRAEAMIFVTTPDQLTLSIQDVWDHFVDSLATGQLDQAILLVDTPRRDALRESLVVLGTDLQLLAAALRGAVRLRELLGPWASFDLVKVDDPAAETSSTVQFHLDGNGNWRLNSF